MTTAPENRGGYRPTAPQNNPANVSATGGAGQSGRATQPARYIAGLPYGEGQATMEQQTSAPMQGASMPQMPQMEMPTLLGAPTMRPNEPITSGIDMGPGPGSEAMRGLPNETPTLLDTLKYLAQFDSSGDAELIYRTILDRDF
jgi:hypothetical protein